MNIACQLRSANSGKRTIGDHALYYIKQRKQMFGFRIFNPRRFILRNQYMHTKSSKPRRIHKQPRALLLYMNSKKNTRNKNNMI